MLRRWLQLIEEQEITCSESKKEALVLKDVASAERLKKEDVILRILNNIEPYLNVDNILYVKYVGKEENKDVFNKYFINYKNFIQSLAKKKYGVSEIKTDKKLNKDRVDWLSSFIETIEAKKISLNIIKD